MHSTLFLLLLQLLLGVSSAASQTDCGRTPIAPIETPDDANIIGGIVARAYSWPWQATLEVDSSDNKLQFGCSGTIITDQWIMTAAHCIRSTPSQVRVGVFNQTRSSESGEQLFNVTSAIHNPNFNMSALSYDIGLIKVDRPIVFSDHVQPVCLPAKLEDVAHVGDLLYATGWGIMNASFDVAILLRQVAVPLNAFEKCEKYYPGPYPQFNNNTMICAGYGGHAPCNGDSGGPLVRKHNETGRWYQIGITSWGEHPCAREDTPVAFTYVSHMCDFIEKVVGTKVCKSL